MNANTYPRARTLIDGGDYSSFELALILVQHEQWQEWPAAYHAPDNVPTWHDWSGQRAVAVDVPRRVYHGDGRMQIASGLTAAALARQLDRWALGSINTSNFLLVPVHNGQERVAAFVLARHESFLSWHASRHAGWMQRRSA